jgi:hypothetical protein
MAGFQFILVKMIRILCALSIAVGLLVPAAARSQETEASEQKNPAPAGDIFSGTVTLLQPDSITVVRKVLGHEPVMRTFVLDGKTKVEGRLRARVRVTVRFLSDEGVYTAIHIIVR